MIEIDYTKKGVLVVGAARSGTHMVCDMLYNYSTVSNKVILGEVLSHQEPTLTAIDSIYIPGKFVFCSLVNFRAKTLLSVDRSLLDDYQIVNVRRRDKVAQYISWCIFRAQTQSSISKHSLDWGDYYHYLPWPSDLNDIEMFITEQNADLAIRPDQIIYYEDAISSGLHTQYRKNQYPVPFDRVVTNIDLVKSILGKYTYDRKE